MVLEITMLNWKFQRGVGVKIKKPSVGGGGGNGYFLESHLVRELR